MNRTCPICGADLAHKKVRRVPLAGELSWLAFRWYLQCPSCSGALQENQHPFEKAVFPTLMIIVALLNFCGFLFGFKVSLPAFVACIALFVIDPLVGRAIVVPKHWNRYVPYSQPKR